MGIIEKEQEGLKPRYLIISRIKNIIGQDENRGYEKSNKRPEASFIISRIRNILGIRGNISGQNTNIIGQNRSIMKQN